MKFELDNFYENLEEPNKSCFLFLRKFILNSHPKMEELWKYKLPFFYVNKQPFCYLWREKDTLIPYISFVRSYSINRPELILGNRKKMKVLPIPPNKDIHTKLIQEIIDESLTYFD